MQTLKKIAAMRARKRIECWMWLSEFPAFQHPWLLKPGIVEDICRIPPPLRRCSKAQIRRTVYAHTHSPEYLQRLKEGGARVDLFGRPV